MNPKELEDLGKAVKTAFGYTPKERTRRPPKAPSKAELSRRWRMETLPTTPPPKK